MTHYTNQQESYAMLHQSLEAYTLDRLTKLAKLVVHKPPLRKGDLIAAIAHQFSGEGLRERWGHMDPLTRAALAEVAHGPDCRFYPERFRAKYGDLPKRYTRDGSYRVVHPDTVLDILLAHNVMSFDIKEALRAFVPPPAEARIGVVPELPESFPLELPSWHRDSKNENGARVTRVETERAGLHDLTAVLRLIDTGKVTASAATNRVTGAGAKAVLSVLRDGDFLMETMPAKLGEAMRPFAWPLLVQAAGLARLSGSKLALSKAGKAALAKPAHTVTKSIWKHWLKTKLLDEFNRIDAIKGQNRKGKRVLTAVAPRRDAIDTVLSLCPPGEWIHIDEFFRFVQASGHDFEVVHDPWNLYISDAQYGSLGYDGFHDWEMLEGRYVMCLLWEYAATLGLVDVAHIPGEWARNDFRDNWGTDDLDELSRYDGLKFFRVNALGAYCLGITDTYEPAAMEVRPALRIQANHEIVVTDRTHFEAGDALFLDRVCAKTHESTWRLDQTKILAAVEEGFDPQEITQFLAAKSDDGLPDTIAHLLEDILKRARQVSHMGTAELFHVEDRATALLILHDSTAKSLCYAAGENRLVVPADKVTAFRRALRKLGYAAPQRAGSA